MLHQRQSLFGLFRCCAAAGVCSLLVRPPLSHLLVLISIETGPGAVSHIHTLAINQQVRPGSIPTHTGHTDEHKDHTHTYSHSPPTTTHPGAALHFIPSPPVVSVDRTCSPRYCSMKSGDLLFIFFCPSASKLMRSLLPCGTVEQH